MEVELNCELQCEHCDGWFRSSVQFGYPEAFFDLVRETCTMSCPMCGTRTRYTKERMRFIRRKDNGSISITEGRFML